MPPFSHEPATAETTLMLLETWLTTQASSPVRGFTETGPSPTGIWASNLGLVGVVTSNTESDALGVFTANRSVPSAERPVIVLRRPRSGEATSFSLRKSRNISACSGQLPTQFMHIRHSALRHAAPPMGSSPPWQLSRQRLQLLHFSASLCNPSTDQRDTAPNSAPSGQIERHHRRVTRRLPDRTSIDKKP